MKVASRKGTAYARTNCIACGQACRSDARNIGAHRRWATHHIEQNPTHEVFVITSNTRIYTTERDTP